MSGIVVSDNVIEEKQRFFIALVPPPKIQEVTLQIIQDLSDRYKTRTAYAPPHITLFPPFTWLPSRISLVEDCLQTVTVNQAPIPIHLAGFGCFAPRVLYIHVEKTPGLLQLQTQLSQALSSQLGIIDRQAKKRAYTPHLTIASRKLTPDTFEDAWNELQHRSLDLNFESDRFILFIYQDHSWQDHKEFQIRVNT